MVNGILDKLSEGLRVNSREERRGKQGNHGYTATGIDDHLTAQDMSLLIGPLAGGLVAGAVSPSSCVC